MSTTSPPARPYSDDFLLAYSREHVYYEFDMFLWAARLLGSGARRGASGPEDEVRLNSALIETFVVHLRNVIEFLYRGTPTSDPHHPYRGTPRETDVVADDFCPSTTWHPPTICPSLADAHDRADKEISHLTTSRPPGKDPRKRWDFAGLSGALLLTMRLFVHTALPSRLSPNVAAVVG
jgi:hypothetical protein